MNKEEDLINTNNTNEKLTIDKELIDRILKHLEEDKIKSKEMILSFTDTAREYVEKAENDIISRFDDRHKKATQSITEIIEKIQISQETMHYFGEEGLEVLRKHFVLYDVRDNIESVFGIMNMCIEGGVDCSSVKSFLGSFSQQDMFAFSSSMKDCIPVFCIYKN